MKHCKDCEPAQEIHFLAYMSVLIGWLGEPLFYILEGLFKNAGDKISEKISLPFINLMIFLKLGHFSYKTSEQDNLRTRCFWEEAQRRGIKMYQFHLGPLKDIFIAEFKNKKITFEGLPRQQSKKFASINWMDDKGIMKKKFQKEGIPVARGGVAWNFRKALKIFNDVDKPVITKPNLGSRSRHTTIHIEDKKELKIGFKKAKQLSPFVIVEEELTGYLFRGTLVGKKLVGVVRRDAPRIIGDGIHSLKELMDKENKRPERFGPIFHQIKIDAEAEKELKRQNISFEEIPESGREIYFSQKTSRGCGGTTTEVSKIIHPKNIQMLERIGKFLDDDLVGIDFIMSDITKSWQEQKHCGIIECNSLPFIDLHHYPLFGQPDNVAGKLWDLILPESKID